MSNGTDGMNSQVAGLVCGGCMFIGMGIGWATGFSKAGLFIGLGVGLVTMAIIMMRKRS